MKPDTDLDESMQKNGQLHPILVRRLSKHRYRCVDGVRRILSLVRVNQTKVLARILDEGDEVHDIPVHHVRLR